MSSGVLSTIATFVEAADSFRVRMDFKLILSVEVIAWAGSRKTEQEEEREIEASPGRESQDGHDTPQSVAESTLAFSLVVSISSATLARTAVSLVPVATLLLPNFPRSDGAVFRLGNEVSGLGPGIEAENVHLALAVVGLEGLMLRTWDVEMKGMKKGTDVARKVEETLSVRYPSRAFSASALGPG
ncbi:hypothetical protein BDP27DRAFT_1397008 [Rhodocollybia butyracea]|uniref:Uncharacterized protein n=1 Tax=Rhodocollybia butyracea TaxID=206335 RepID=A0A9P5QCF7_9AGAR|nr:hypothetical protein BDP27DRAFT_1397008 [Rhodocollybia butyracea]